MIQDPSRWTALLISAVCVLGISEAQERPQEPEILGVPYYFAPTDRTLMPLERQVAKVRFGASRRIFGVGGASAEIGGEKSPVRIRADQKTEKTEFIVRLAAGVDPSKFVLYFLQPKSGKRSIRYGSAGLPEGSIPVLVTKFGEFSYRLTPDRALGPGEYCYSPPDANDVFAFGIDRREP